MLPFIPLIFNILMGLIISTWLYRDAKSRDNMPFLWGFSAFVSSIFLAFSLPLIGSFFVLVVYLILRPKGPLHGCPHCKKKVLKDLAFCPNCGRPMKKDCYRCHEAVDYTFTNCPKCHAKL